MSVSEAGDIKQLAATTTADDINFVRSVSRVYLKTTADVYIAFDRAATTADFLLASTDGITEFDVTCTYVSVKAATTATVYAIGSR